MNSAPSLEDSVGLLFSLYQLKLAAEMPPHRLKIEQSPNFKTESLTLTR